MEQTPDLNSLINLLDDPDDMIFDHVRERLIDIGHEAIPALEDAQGTHDLGELFQGRVEGLIQSIRYEAVCKGLVRWKQKGGKDLLEGALLIARYEYPDLDEQAVHDFIDRVKQDVWIELNNHLTALEKIRVLNHIFFDVHGMKGNTDDYHAPDNSFIHCVVDAREGNPISLCILYMIIAQRLSIPVYGVNLPKHFVLAYADQELFTAGKPGKGTNILFYVNPFSKGAVFGKRDIEKFLEQLNLDKNNLFFQPCDHVTILKRVLNNLIYSYQRIGDKDKMRELHYLASALA